MHKNRTQIIKKNITKLEINRKLDEENKLGRTVK